MPTIVYQTDKHGRKYAYESQSYWSKSKKAPRTRRTYLGRVDENGNIIPKKVDPSTVSAASTGSGAQSNSTNSQLSSDEVRILIEEMHAMMSKMDTIMSSFTQAVETMSEGLKKK